MSAAVPMIAMLVAGAAIAVQSLFSGTLGLRVGILESSFIIHLGGVLLAGLILLALRGGSLVQASAWKSVPWYVYTGGFIGVLIVAAYSYAVPKLGLASAITLAIAVQLVLSAVLDHYGVLGTVEKSFDLYRGLGIAALMLGTWLLVR